MTDRTTAMAVIVVLGCTLVVGVRAATAPPPPLEREAAPNERAQAAEAIASDEWTWTKETTQNFPADQWSQRDDFHASESRRMEALAKKSGVRIEGVLRAVDDDIHRRSARGDGAPDGRNARAIPCKPRPFYD